MRLPIMALALSTLCLTSCARPAPRAIPVTLDPAPFALCPVAFPAAPTLSPLMPFALPDGRVVVLLDTVIARETVTARYIIQGRGAWHECQSAVAYALDWSVRVRTGEVPDGR
jgi:hypothetical protein